MMNTPVSSDYLLISKALTTIFGAYKPTVLEHEDNRFKDRDVTHYYELRLGLPLNGILTTLFLYETPEKQVILTDLGTLVFTNRIIEPLAKRELLHNRDQQKYENYDIFASEVLKEPAFQKYLTKFGLKVNDMEIQAVLPNMNDTETGLTDFKHLFDDLLGDNE